MDDRSWHTPDFPELRDGPPWLTAEMIAAQSALPSPILGAGAAATIAAGALAAAQAGAPVVTIGCGTSQHGAMAVAELLEDALARAGAAPAHGVESRDAFEAMLAPRRGGFAIGVSHDGGTPATARALAAARAAGAGTAVITATPGGATAAGADAVLVTPLHDDSWCHTVAYVSAILAGAAIAEHVAPVGLDGAAADAAVAALLASARPQAVATAAGLAPAAHLVAAGSGADRGTSRELALKIEEGVRRACTQRDLETLLHGHLVACDGTTGLVAVLLDPRGRPTRLDRGVLALGAARVLGMRAAAILDAAGDAAIDADLTPAGRIVLDAGPALPGVAGALLAGAVGAQHLTLALVEGAGTNPDLIRREEQPWRDAAALLESGRGW